MSEERLEKIRALEAKKNREWDKLQFQRQKYNELAYEVGDRQREFNSVSEDIATAFDYFQNSDVPGVHEAYLSGKRVVDDFVDRFGNELKNKQREYEERYDVMGRDMQKMLNKYDDEIDGLRRQK